MSWIKTVPVGEASGRLATLYQRVRGPDGKVDNILVAQSLRPHALEGHMALYKSVLHHASNTLPKWRLELLGVWVSLLNGCAYCVEHHFRDLCRDLGDEARAGEMRRALERDNFNYFTTEDRALLVYAFKLTTEPASVNVDDIAALRDAGYSDEDILEANQVIAYFAYANRTVLGLGVSLEGDELGRAPRDTSDADEWRHE